MTQDLYYYIIIIIIIIHFEVFMSVKKFWAWKIMVRKWTENNEIGKRILSPKMGGKIKISEEIQDQNPTKIKL